MTRVAACRIALRRSSLRGLGMTRPYKRVSSQSKTRPHHLARRRGAAADVPWSAPDAGSPGPAGAERPARPRADGRGDRVKTAGVERLRGGNLVTVSSVAPLTRTQAVWEARHDGRARTSRHPTRSNALRERSQHSPGTTSGGHVRLPEGPPVPGHPGRRGRGPDDLGVPQLRRHGPDGGRRDATVQEGQTAAYSLGHAHG